MVLDHLRGRHVMGVYPILGDDTCWFLAADFDGASWKEDIAAFVSACRSADVPVIIERSRSGTGAHAWFFFEAPINAGIARKMGCYFITQAMTRRHQLGMASYDRLFPNQDTMPRGGFGNLIALPLQYEPRQHGNTLFIDDDFAPFADQWAVLASVTRMAPAAVEAIAREATRSGHIVGVRFSDPSNGDLEKPWLPGRSGMAHGTLALDNLPKEVRSVIAQRLFVEKLGLPSPLLNEIKRLAAFQNPEFYQKQATRLSTAMTPRVIACAEDLPLHIALPRGCLEDLRSLLNEFGGRLEVDDQRCLGEEASFRFQGELTPIQKQAARALVRHDIGVFVAPPGIGKTVLATYLIAERGRNCLILVHRRPLLDQWIAQLSMFLGIDHKEVGQIGGGKRRANGQLDVAMIQTLVRKGSVSDIVGNYGHVIVDECHHIPAVSFERVLSEVRARYILGLTATPERRDGHDPILQMQLGPTRFSVDPKAKAAQRPFDHNLVVRETAFRLEMRTPNPSIQEIYRSLGVDEPRNQLILNDVIKAIEDKRSPIVLTERRDHLDYLAARLRGFVRHLILLRGGMTPKARDELTARLSGIPDDEERLVIATGRYIGEGFDDARLDTLFLAMPISWKGTLVQYTGRLHRLHPGKTSVRIYDYVDGQVPMLMRMFEKRLRTYRGIGYGRGEAPLGLAEQAEDRIVEYDEQALRHFDLD
ncbi:MAG: DEAD/DEAH box helicase family protein [Gemmatimonadota bacterium]